MTNLGHLLEQALSPLVSEEEVYYVANSHSGNIERVCKLANCLDSGDFIPKKRFDPITTKPYDSGLYRLRLGPRDHIKTSELFGFLGCRFYQPCATTTELLSFVAENEEVAQKLFSRRLRIVGLGRDLFLGPSHYAATIGIGTSGQRELKKVELLHDTRWSRKDIFLLRATS